MSFRRPARLGTATGSLIVALALGGCPGQSGAHEGRKLHVSPHGSDRGHGSPRRPWRSLGRALRSARAGDTVVLARGSYGRRGSVIRVRRGGSHGRPITIRGPLRGPWPRLLGHVRVDASHVRFSRLLFDGPTGPVLPKTSENPRGEEVQIWLKGDDVDLSSCDVRGSAWHAGVYVTGHDVQVRRCHIHNNGDPQRENGGNLDQGVYWDSGSGVLANNVVDHNVAFGVQLYQSPDGVKVFHNTIVGNGRAGLIFSADAANNIVANNIVAFNGAAAVSFDLRGSGNVLAGNLFWANGGSDVTATEGLAPQSNLVAEPRFVGPTDFRLLAGSPAIGRALKPYSVRYDLRGRPRPSRRPADLGAYQSRQR